MVDGINGKFQNLNFFTAKELTKKEETKEVKKDVPVGKQAETKEVGDDLLDPRLFTNALGFVRQAKPVDKEDATDLNKMFALAGITAKPTQEEYNRVKTEMAVLSNRIDTIGTTNNAERLFASNKFEALNKQFGIS